jgi:hypothetical protein
MNIEFMYTITLIYLNIRKACIEYNSIQAFLILCSYFVSEKSASITESLLLTLVFLVLEVSPES